MLSRRGFLKSALGAAAGLAMAVPGSEEGAAQTPAARPEAKRWIVSEYSPGGYRYIPAVRPFSAGVAALPGYEIQRVRFRTPVPLAEGFAQVERIIIDTGRPLTAFCACELRSPAPFTEQGFRAFNESYVVTLGKWGIFDGRINPVARSNVCPEIDPPSEPSFHAFSFTIESADAPKSFVNAGSGENFIRRGDTSPGGMLEKARYVLDEMERRMAALGFHWADTTASQVYTVFDLYPFLADEIVRRGAARAGLTWHFCRPPVVDLDYEMDCRGVRIERVV
jgi:hypothetical protein